MPEIRMIPYHRLSKDELAKHAEQAARTGVEIHPFASQRSMTAGYLHAMGYAAADAEEDYGIGARLPTEKRPALVSALMRIRQGEADGLIVTKMDRLSRSSAHFPVIATEFRKRGWNLVSLDLGLDYRTPGGKLIAAVLVALGEWEAERIGERTSEALAERKRAGVVLGARAHRDPKLVDDAARNRILELKADKLSLRRIAATMDREGFQPPRGGLSWGHMTVVGVLNQQSGAS